MTIFETTENQCVMILVKNFLIFFEEILQKNLESKKMCVYLQPV